MSFSEEDFNTSDAWLSEQLFAQLKDFNAEYKDRTTSDFMLSESFSSCSSSMPLLEEDITTEELKSATLDSFDAAFKMNNFTENYDVNEEVLDLSQIPLKENPTVEPEQLKESLINLVENIPLVPPPVVAEAATIVTEPVKENVISPAFDVTEEEMKILKFLETQPKAEILGMVNHLPRRTMYIFHFISSFKGDSSSRAIANIICTSM